MMDAVNQPLVMISFCPYVEVVFAGAADQA